MNNTVLDVGKIAKIFFILITIIMIILIIMFWYLWIISNHTSSLTLLFLLVLSIYFWKIVEANTIAHVEFDSNLQQLVFTKTWGKTIIKKEDIVWWRITWVPGPPRSILQKPISFFEARLKNDKQFYYPLKPFSNTSTSLNYFEDFFYNNLKIKPKSRKHFSSPFPFTNLSLPWRFSFWHFTI